MTTMMLLSDEDNPGGGAPPDSATLGEHRIRIDFSYTETMVAPNAPSALFEICTVWNQQLGDALFVDHAGHPIVLDQWPSQQTFAERFSLTIVEARKRHIYVGFTLRTNTKF
jgi:hypothetical protein